MNQFDQTRQNLKDQAIAALKTGSSKLFIICKVWGFDCDTYTEGLEIWAELHLPTGEI
ncbi:hypothetical protein H6F86_00485 [Phormidium sp. FACHB-592]|uniref:Uncharacterized protein n=1 Tax=Stenomitos frigidus AS-A4 TaxID=2933935 RepID=A0ABV0KVP2_9CYAN|nr:hypothetical protein [Phormidium sp. FACHB-592]MBD2072411.1 hypothetical protein [Phormidium sp. FACHB-592]